MRRRNTEEILEEGGIGEDQVRHGWKTWRKICDVYGSEFGERKQRTEVNGQLW